MKRSARRNGLEELDAKNGAAQPRKIRHRARQSGPTIAIFVAMTFPVFLGTSVLAQSDAEFMKANQAYAQGHFVQAIDGYEGLVRSRQWSANLFYNLGNAYFRTGDFGRAILNYERALALERHHPEATANLQIARDETRALEMDQSWSERYLRSASSNQYSIMAAIAFWVGVLCVIRRVFLRRRSNMTVGLAIFSLLIFATSTFAIYEFEYGSKGRALAIVTGKDVQARLATADTANAVLALPPGSEIKILSTRGDWLYAALPSNLRGWVPAKDAEPVRL
jgi:tetratricopeptide (TPR) repeat protein